MKKYDKILIRFTAIAFLVIALFQTVTPVHAADAPLTILTVSNSNLQTILTDLKTRQSGWFSDFKYFLYRTGTDRYSIFLFPKAVSTTIIFADNQYDSTYQSDIDKWYLQAKCTTSNLCYRYEYWISNNTYNLNSTYSVDTQWDFTTWSLYYTNVPAYTYLSQFVPPYTYTTSTTSFDLTNYGFKPIPTDVLIALGLATANTDQQQTDQLIEANWGMFNWLRDGLNEMFGWVLGALEVVLSPLNGILEAAFVPTQEYWDGLYDDFIEPVTVKLGFLWYPFDWLGSIVSGINGASSSGRFVFGTLFGADLALDMTVFHDKVPSVWNFFVLMAKGVLSYELIAGFFSKVTGKMRGNE